MGCGLSRHRYTHSAGWWDVEECVRLDLVLDSEEMEGYLDSRMVRLRWRPYPMAKGG